MQLSLRPYEPTDAQGCCDVINSAIASMDGLNDAARLHVRETNTPHGLGPDLARWITLVVLSDDQIVGLGALDQDELKRVYVDPDSQRSGAATLLMRALEQIAWERGLRTIRLDASPSSVSFYASLGFVAIGEDRLEVGRAVFRFVQMTKDIEA